MVDKQKIDEIYAKIKPALLTDIYRAKRYSIPLSIVVMEMEEKGFIQYFRKSDQIFHLYNDIYMILALFCDYERSLEMVKRLKREYAYRYNKELKILNVTYTNTYPIPDKELLYHLLEAFDNTKSQSKGEK